MPSSSPRPISGPGPLLDVGNPFDARPPVPSSPQERLRAAPVEHANLRSGEAEDQAGWQHLHSPYLAYTEPGPALSLIAEDALAALPGLAAMEFVHPSLEHHYSVIVPSGQPTRAVRSSLVVKVPCCGAGLEVTAWSSPTAESPVGARSLAPYARAAMIAVIHVHALAAVSTERDQLREALTSRAPIDQAKGMIMMSTGCTPETAFARLVHLSSTQNVKLRDIAAGIVRDGVALGRYRRPH